MADTSALDALAALADELQAARAAVRSYETMLNWHVTCERCAAQLDELYAATVARIVAAVAPLIERDSRAAALEEAAGECRTERRWQTEREDRRLPPDSVKARMLVVENLLRDRAKRIREGR